MGKWEMGLCEITKPLTIFTASKNYYWTPGLHLRSANNKKSVTT